MDTIVVGIDGSPGAEDALRWAIALARAHGAELELVTALDIDVPRDEGDRPVPAPEDSAASRRAARVQREAADVVAASVPSRTEVVVGRPAEVLVGRDGDLLVVGTRGHGRLAATLLGSVARDTVRTATTPVVVVPTGGGSVPPRRIAVGVDGSPVADRAVAWAVDEARVHDAVVELVHSDEPARGGATTGEPRTRRPDPDDERAGARLVLAVLERVEHDGVDVEWTLGEDRPDRCLVDRAADADLLVVGARGLGEAEGLVLGSTSQRVLARSPVPVVVLT